MKKILAALLFLGFLSPLFSFELTDLEKRIIRSEPEEMLSIVLDRSLEGQLFAIYRRYEDLDVDLEEVVESYMTAFPGTNDEECQFMLFKLGLVTSLGSGDWQTVYDGLQLLMFCIQINTMVDMEELPEEFADLVNSSYWQDCTSFSRLFDYESFMDERFPGDFPGDFLEDFFEDEF
jgi:hypothetical protein